MNGDEKDVVEKVGITAASSGAPIGADDVLNHTPDDDNSVAKPRADSVEMSMIPSSEDGERSAEATAATVSKLTGDDVSITILDVIEEMPTSDTKYTIILVLVRLILTPLISFALVYLMDAWGIHWLLPQDKLFRFIVLIEAGMPTAQTCAIMMKQLGLERAAYVLSGGFIAQYSFSTISMTLLVIAAQQFVENTPVV